MHCNCNMFCRFVHISSCAKEKCFKCFIFKLSIQPQKHLTAPNLTLFEKCTGIIQYCVSVVTRKLGRNRIFVIVNSIS